MLPLFRAVIIPNCTYNTAAPTSHQVSEIDLPAYPDFHLIRNFSLLPIDREYPEYTLFIRQEGELTVTDDKQRVVSKSSQCIP